MLLLEAKGMDVSTLDPRQLALVDQMKEKIKVLVLQHITNASKNHQLLDECIEMLAMGMGAGMPIKEAYRISAVYFATEASKCGSVIYDDPNEGG